MRIKCTARPRADASGMERIPRLPAFEVFAELCEAGLIIPAVALAANQATLAHIDRLEREGNDVRALRDPAVLACLLARVGGVQ